MSRPSSSRLAMLAFLEVILVAAFKSRAQMLQVTEESFPALIEKQDLFLKFFSPSCPHCRTVAPVWQELAQDIEKLSRDEAAAIGEVDCTVSRSLCQRFNIRGVPSFFYLDKSSGDSGNSAKVFEYRMARDLQSFKNFFLATPEERSTLAAEATSVNVRPPTGVKAVLTNFFESLNMTVQQLKMIAAFSPVCVMLLILAGFILGGFVFGVFLPSILSSTTRKCCESSKPPATAAATATSESETEAQAEAQEAASGRGTASGSGPTTGAKDPPTGKISSPSKGGKKQRLAEGTTVASPRSPPNKKSD